MGEAGEGQGEQSVEVEGELDARDVVLLIVGVDIVPLGLDGDGRNGIGCCL